MILQTLTKVDAFGFSCGDRERVPHGSGNRGRSIRPICIQPNNNEVLLPLHVQECTHHKLLIGATLAEVSLQSDDGLSPAN